MQLQQAINFDDIRTLARKRLPRIAFDFIDGGVDGEAGLERNRVAFDRYRLLPRYLVDVERRRQTVNLLGYTSSSPDLGVPQASAAGSRDRLAI